MDFYRAWRELFFDVRQRAVQYGFAAIDQHNPFAQRLDLVHLVRREDDRFARRAQFADQILDDPDVDGIEPLKRFVQNHEIGIVDDAGDKLHLLLHPARQFLDLVPPPLGQFDAREQFRRALLRRRVRQAL